MSKKAQQVIKEIRNFISLSVRELSKNDYREVVDTIGSDFDGFMDAIREEDRNKGEE